MMKKKIVSLLLVLVLLMGIIPSTALTASAAITIDYVASLTVDGVTENYTDLENAFFVASQATGDSVTLKLLRDVTMEVAVAVIQGKFTIDLNGKVWLKSGGSENLYVANGADVKITDTSSEGSGKIIGSGGDPYVRVAVVSGGKLEVAGGTIENHNVAAAITVGIGPSIRDDAQLILSGGTVKAGTGDAIWAYGKSVTLKGGSVEGTISYSFGALTVEGDYTDLAIEFYCRESYPSEDSVITLPEGYGFYRNGQLVDTLLYGDDYTIGALPAASNNEASVTIGGVTTEYATLQEAINAARSSADRSTTVKLLRDIDASRYVVATSGCFTLDLNGKAWTSTSTSIGTMLFVNGTADVKIIDSSTEQSGKISCTMENATLISMYDDAKLEIAGGTIESVNGVRAIVVGMNVSEMANAELTISGGQIKSSTYVFETSSKQVTLKGGTIEGGIVYYNGILNIETDYSDGAFLFGCENYPTESNQIILPEGYGFYRNGQLVDTLFYGYDYTIGALPAASNNEASVTIGGVTTEYATLPDALNAIISSTDRNNTVKLLRDIEFYGYPIFFSGSFTIDLNGKTWTATSEYRIMEIGGTADIKITDSSADGSGKIYGSESLDTGGIILTRSAKLEIAGGTLEHCGVGCTISAGPSLVSPENVELTVSGGKIIGSEDGALQSSGKSVTLSGGSIEGRIIYGCGELILEGDYSGLKLVLASYDYPTEENKITLPEGYCFYEDGQAVTSFSYGGIYTIGEAQYLFIDNEIRNGAVTASPADAEEGDTVTLTVTPDAGYTLSTLTVLDANGDEIPLDENNSFVVPSGGATVYAIFLLDSDFHEKDGYKIIWSEKFDGESLPEDFTSIDADGDGYGWIGNSGALEQGLSGVANHDCDAGHSIASPSYISTESLPLNSDNRLVFPAFELKKGNEYLLSFMIRSFYNKYPDAYSVAISLDGGNTFVKTFDKTAASEEWKEVVIDLSEYAGNTVTVVVLHQDYDKYYLMLDCVHLYEKVTAIGELYSELDVLKNAVADLQTALSDAASVEALNEAIENLNKAIEDAKKAVLEADGAQKQELLSEISKAQNAAVEAAEEALDEARKELEAVIDKKADITALNEAIENLNKAIDLAKTAAEEANSLLRNELMGEIEKAQKAAVEAAEKALDEAKKELEAAIDKKADITALNEAIENLNKAIDLAKTAAEEANSLLRNELMGEIEKAQKAAVEAAEKALDEAKKELEAAIDKKADITALNEAIENLNKAIDLAKTTAEEANTALRNELMGEIEKAQKAAVEAAEKALEEARAALEDAIAKGDKANADALAEAVKELNAAIELAKKAAKDADDALKQNLEGQLAEAETELKNAIDTVQKNLENAQTLLEGMIAEGDKANADALAEAIRALNASIEDAKAIAAEADDALRAFLLKAIMTAKNGAIESANAALAEARAELEAEIAKGDAANADALKAAIELLEKAIALAQETAIAHGVESSQSLESMIAEARSELLQSLESVKAELNAAIKKLQENSDKLNADLIEKESDLLDAIESLRAELESVKEQTPSMAAPIVIAIVALLAGVGAIVFVLVFKKKD